MDLPGNYKKGFVTGDFLPDGMVLPCYTNSVQWNGFGCPAFEFYAAIQLCEVEDLGLSYDSENDQFICRTEFKEDSPVEIFKASAILCGGVAVKVHHIGAFSWTWNQVKEKK